MQPATETQGLGGSTLLNVLDSFALNNFNASDDASQSEDKSNIGITFEFVLNYFFLVISVWLLA